MHEDWVPKSLLVVHGYWSRCWPLERGKGLVCRALNVACWLGPAGPAPRVRCLPSNRPRKWRAHFAAISTGMGFGT